MSRKSKDCQVVVRLYHTMNSKIEKAANKLGLTKAAWVRQLIAKKLEETEQETV